MTPPLLQPQAPRLGLLLSAAVDRQHGAAIDAIAARSGTRIERLTVEALTEEARAETSDPAARARIDLAFFSRERYEGSSLRRPGPLSDQFFAIADQCPNLRWLQVCSAGLDLPQYQPSLARGVRVTGATGVTAGPIAQTVLAAIAALSRGFPHWLDAQSRREWRPIPAGERPRDLAGQRVVIVGAGAIGSAIGRLLRAIGLHVTAVRRSAMAGADFDRTVGSEALDALLPDCDWLVLAAPLTAQTRGMIDAARLARLPARAGLVNVARGELVDEPALIAALRARQLRWAYLDAFATEPLPADSPLWDLPGVWISPHNSSASAGHEERVVEVFLSALPAEIERLLKPDRAG